MREHQPISATREIQTIHRALLDELGRSVQFAALGERFAQLPGDAELPPYRSPLVFGIAPDLELAVRADFGGQSARVAALAMLASVGSALRRLFALRRTVEHLARAGDLTPDEVDRVITEAHDVGRKENELSLLQAVVASSRPELDEARKWLEGLLKLRDPLARRDGAVEAHDVPAGAEGIRVVWRKNVVALDGNQFEQLALVLPAHPGLGLRFIEQTRVYRAGQSLGLTSSDCDDIAISLSCLSLAVCEELHREIGALLAQER